MHLRLQCLCNDFFTSEVEYRDIPHLFHSVSGCGYRLHNLTISPTLCSGMPLALPVIYYSSVPGVFVLTLHTLYTFYLQYQSCALQTHAGRCGTALWPSCVRKGRTMNICTSRYLVTNRLPEWTQHIFCCSFSLFSEFQSNNCCMILLKHSQSLQKDIT